MVFEYVSNGICLILFHIIVEMVCEGSLDNIKVKRVQKLKKNNI